MLCRERQRYGLLQIRIAALLLRGVRNCDQNGRFGLTDNDARFFAAVATVQEFVSLCCALHVEAQEVVPVQARTGIPSVGVVSPNPSTTGRPTH